MVLDFNSMQENILHEFKGGKGDLAAKMISDENGKIMLGRLAPGCSIGLHTHVGNYEAIYIISGTATFLYDDGSEQCPAGCAHYCPEHHSHSFLNNTDTDIIFFAVVPEK